MRCSVQSLEYVLEIEVVKPSVTCVLGVPAKLEKANHEDFISVSIFHQISSADSRSLAIDQRR